MKYMYLTGQPYSAQVFIGKTRLYVKKRNLKNCYRVPIHFITWLIKHSVFMGHSSDIEMMFWNSMIMQGLCRAMHSQFPPDTPIQVPRELQYCCSYLFYFVIFLPIVFSHLHIWVRPVPVPYISQVSFSKLLLILALGVPVTKQ